MLAEKIKQNQGAQVINMPERKNKSFIPNEFFDVVARIRIPGEQMQVLSAIARKTWCWSKDSDRIATSQIVEVTGLKKQNVFRAIQSLKAKNIISVIKNDNKTAHVIEINADFSSWAESSKKIPSSKVIEGVIKNDDKTSSKVMDTKDNKDTYTKDIKNSSCPGFENPDEETPEKHLEPAPEVKSKAKKYTYQEKHLLVANLLASEIKRNKPDFKLPSKPDDWANTARLMEQVDGRSLEDIRAVILWSQKDSFWSNNVLSMAAVRKQFDRLQLKARERPQKRGFQTVHDRNRQACEDFLREDY